MVTVRVVLPQIVPQDLLSAPDKTGFLTCQMFRHLSKVFVVDTF